MGVRVVRVLIGCTDTAGTAQDGTGSTITDTGTAATPDGRGTPLDATRGFLVIQYGRKP